MRSRCLAKTRFPMISETGTTPVLRRCCSLGQAAESHQSQRRFLELPRMCEVHRKFRHPVVMPLRVHEHLTAAPSLLFLRRCYVGVPCVLGFVV